jgi:signal transduction histidine kinase
MGVRRQGARVVPRGPRARDVSGGEAGPDAEAAVGLALVDAGTHAAIEAALDPDGLHAVRVRTVGELLRKLGRLDPALVLLDPRLAGEASPREIVRLVEQRGVPLLPLGDARDPRVRACLEHLPERVPPIECDADRPPDVATLRARVALPLRLHDQRRRLEAEAQARAQAEARLHEAERRCLALSARLASIRDEERARIARGIHDELGQVLIGLRMDVVWLARRFGGRNRLLAQKAAAMTGLIDSTVHRVRRIVTGLRPAVLDRLGLAAAIGRQAGEFEQRTGIRCRCTLPEAGLEPGGEICAAIYRSLQELLTNVARHARASCVDVRLQLSPERVVLEVEDDGIGMPAGGPGGDALGLVGIRERAQLFGGSFTMDGARGTRGTLEIPLVEVHPLGAAEGMQPRAPP